MVVEGIRAPADQPTFLFEELPVGLSERSLDVSVGAGETAVARHRRDVARRHDVNLEASLNHRHCDAQLRVFAYLRQYLSSSADPENLFAQGLPGPVYSTAWAHSSCRGPSLALEAELTL